MRYQSVSGSSCQEVQVVTLECFLTLFLLKSQINKGVVPECCQHLRRPRVWARLRVKECFGACMRFLRWHVHPLCLWMEAGCFVCQRDTSRDSVASGKRETEILSKVSKLVSSFPNNAAIAGDRPSLLSGLLSPPLCCSLHKRAVGVTE